MKQEKVISWAIGLIGMFILPPIIDFFIGIGLFVFAISEKEKEKCDAVKLYGAYFFLAGVIGYILRTFFLDLFQKVLSFLLSEILLILIK